MATTESNTTADELIKLVTPLDPITRDRHVARFGRELLATNTALLNPLIASLEQRGSYESGIAALIAVSTNNVDWITSHLGDTNPSIQNRALRAARGRPEVIGDDAFEAALEDASHVARRRILSSLNSRTALADRLIQSVRIEWGAHEAALVLPFCSPPVVSQLLPDIAYAVRRWRAIARNHRSIALQALKQNYLRGVLDYNTWWGKYGTAMARLFEVYNWRKDEDNFVLDLLDTFDLGLTSSPPLSLLHVLAQTHPGRLLQALRKPPDHISRRLNASSRRALARSSLPELTEYLRTCGNGILSSYLSAQPPKLRPITFAATELAISPTKIPLFVLDTLPSDYAATVASGALKAIEGQGETWQHELKLRSYLPHKEVAETLLAVTRKSSADDRKLGWQLYVDNVARARDPQLLASTLEMMVDRLLNEQSPVRSSAMQALLQVPSSLWSPASGSLLVHLVENALQARDYGEWYQVNTLAFKMLRDSRLEDCGVAIVKAVVTRSRNTSLGNLSELSPRVVGKLYAALAGLMDADAEGDDYELLLKLAQQLGRRAENIPTLQSRLRQVIGQSKDDSDVRTAIELYLKPKVTRSNRVAEVFALDPSTAALPPVAATIASRRTDLLTQAFTAAGRFISTSDWYFKGYWNDAPSWQTSSLGYLTVANRHAANRWTPAQCRAYLSHLGRLLDDTRATTTRALAVKAAGIVPSATAIVLSFTDDEEVLLAEAALGTLGHCPDQLPKLLEYVSSDRARVATFAASQAAQYTRPSVLAPLLAPILSDHKAKVTSRKEIARMVATFLPASVAAAALLPAFTNSDTHKDVRVAIIQTSIANLLGTPEAWEMIEAAAVSDIAEARQAVIVQADSVPPSHRERYGPLLLPLAHSTDDDTAALALECMVGWQEYAPETASVLSSVLGDMTRVSKRVWQAAARSLILICPKAEGLAALKEVVSRLNVQPEPTTSMDLPMHRRIEFISQHMGPVRGAGVSAAQKEIARLLAQNDRTIPDAARLLVQSLDEPTLADLQEILGLCKDRPILTSEVARSFTRLSTYASVLEPWALASAVAEVSTAGAIFSAVMLAAASGSTEWNKWRDLASRLRDNANPDVRMMADSIELEKEVEE